MVLTPEQVAELKAQLHAQIQNMPEPQKSQAQQQIDEMSAEALEELVRQQQERNAGGGQQKTIFRMIVDKDVEAVKVDENEEAVAVLEINPISKGHTIIIPKSVVSQEQTLPAGVFALAQKVVDKLTNGLSAKTVEIQTEVKFGEKIVNLIPTYGQPLTLNSPRTRVQKNELEEIVKQLEPKPKQEVITITTTESAERQVVQRKRRIPS